MTRAEVLLCFAPLLAAAAIMLMCEVARIVADERARARKRRDGQ